MAFSSFSSPFSTLYLYVYKQAAFNVGHAYKNSAKRKQRNNPGYHC